MKSILFILATMLAAVSTTLAQQTPTFPHQPLMEKHKGFLEFAKSFHAPTPHHQRKVQSLASVSAVKQRLDSLVADTIKESFTYNAQGQAISWLISRKNSSGQWRNKRLYTFNYENNISTKYDRDELNNTWKPDYQYEDIYYPNGLIQEQIYYWYWNASDSIWGAKEKTTFEYDNEGKEILRKKYIFNYFVGMWREEYKGTSTYNTDGNIVEIVWENNNGFSSKYTYEYNAINKVERNIDYYWSNTDSTWVYRWKKEFVYDAAGNSIQEIMANWSSNTNTWTGYGRQDFTYNNQHKRIGLVFYFWDTDSSEWKPRARRDSPFDIHGNPLGESSYLWDTTSSAWIGNRKTEYAYNLSYTIADLITLYDMSMMAHMIVSGTEYQWNVAANDWQQNEHFIFHYSPQEITSVHENKNTAAKVYPHPAKEFFTVALQEQATVSLYDAQGRKALEETLQPNSQVSLKDLPTGLYYYQICTANGNKQSGKLVKE